MNIYNGEEKLSINSYVGKETFNIAKAIDGINVGIISKNVHMDYVIYSIVIENTTGKTIMLDSREKTNSTYITDRNESKFVSYNHELLIEDLIIENGHKAFLDIKFDKTYTPTLPEEKLVFADVILDYNVYNQSQNKLEYKDRKNVEIELEVE